MIKKIHILGIILASVLLVSCIEERLSADDTENASAYLQVRGNSLLSSTDPLDNEIKSLRILAFKKSSGQCVSNKLYSAELNDVINHPIDEGVYDFVFLANEPNLVNVLDGLNGINDYADLGNITYPEQAFRSDVSIPMFQELKNVEILPNRGNNDDDIEALKAFQTRWAEIGFVPIKEKETVQNEFRKLINDHFDQLDIDEFEKNIERFKSKINTFDNSDDKDSKIIQEREKLVNKIKQLETDLHAWENNIGFFSKSSNSESLVKEFSNKIESARHKLALMQEKLRLIDGMI